MRNVGKAKPKGSILVFVLALIVLLGVLSLRLMKETVQELRHVSQFHKRDDLRTYAYSALDLAVGVLNEFRMVEGTLYAPGQGWGNPLEYSGIDTGKLMASEDFDQEERQSPVKWSIQLIDESAKVPFSKTNQKDLVALFSVMRAEEDSLVDEDEEQPFYDALMDWQDSDDEDRDEGAEDDYYEDLDPPYFTPGKKIENFEEFRMIKGFAYDEDEPDYSGIFYDSLGSETINLQNFRNSFSFFNQDTVNVNGLSPFLVKFLCGDDERLYEEFMEGPSASSREPYYTSLNDPKLRQLAERRGINLSATATMFRVLITVSKGKANFQLHAVLGLEGKGSGPGGKLPKKPSKARSKQNQKIQYPFRVLSLRENENLID